MERVLALQTLALTEQKSFEPDGPVNSANCLGTINSTDSNGCSSHSVSTCGVTETLVW